MIYTLTATKDGTTCVYQGESDSQLGVTIDAIGEVLNKAADVDNPHRDVWATGRIELSDDEGNVLQVMEAK